MATKMYGWTPVPKKGLKLVDPWKPFSPEAPPPGSYDPALDAQQAATNRGYQNLQADTALGDSRALQDYGIGSEDLKTSRDRTYADLDTQLANLSRQFKQQGRSQLQGANRAGVISGGAILQAAAKRKANEAIAQQPIDTARTRTGEDYKSQFGKLTLGYDRGVTDRGTALQRAGFENTQFGIDTEKQREFAASQTGFDPLANLPGNEHTTTKAEHGFGANVAYRTIVIGGQKWRVDQNGRLVSRV